MGSIAPGFEIFWGYSSIFQETEVSPATTAKLLQLFSDQKKSEFLQLELAVVINAGEPFVKATYSLEGYGVLVFQCHEIYTCLLAAVELQH